MARKKKKEKTLSKIKIIIGIIFVISLASGVVYGAIYFLNHSEYFKVRTIKIDSSLQFIDKRDLAVMKGKNIFEIDLRRMQHKLNIKYPQVKDLKVVKRFPDQVLVVARKREPFAQIKQKSTVLTLDENGIVLSKSSEYNKKLPQVIGLGRIGSVSLGKPVKGLSLGAALKMISEVQANQRNFSSIKIKDIDVSDLSKIIFHLTNELEVIVDKDKIEHKIRVLGIILSQNTLDLDKVKYIDLRFKEPIVGKK